MRYSDKTLEYYENIKNIGEFDEKLNNIGTGIVGSPLCGDVMKLQLFFNDKDIIVDAKYKVFGCVSAIASMELATTILKGLDIEKALQIKNSDVANSLELSDIKKHCSVLAKEAIEAAVNNYLAKKNNRNNMITISEQAVTKLKDLILEHGGVGVSISVISGGCSGIDYSLAYESEEHLEKSKIEVDGINFFYDPSIELLINGLTINLVENSFGHGFVITNKNHIGCQNCSCGCK